MCGRFTLLADTAKIEEQFGTIVPIAVPQLFNIAPTQPILIIKHPEAARPENSNLPPHDTSLMRWGFIPAFAKEPDKWPLTFNIRAETVHIKKSFRNALNHRRIIIPASGFFEWKKNKTKQNEPYYITSANSSLIGFAGLAETWSGADGTEIDTAGIITTAANDDIKIIHQRMPLIISKENYQTWLDVRNYRGEDVLRMLSPLGTEKFLVRKISTKVNDVNYRSEDLLDEIQELETTSKSQSHPDQLSLF
ncbi:SOS response-associated peptidase [Bartonella sp. HY329]|uniref:SOS response-associated peptidase n=1 Tax=unclassified Bartonella TaxID=2645622 RepID=UPI0021C6EB85|nr:MULTISPECIES: SOS response-associated peptidase [unclassified Bartonella]UXM93863.1 SOS response-associated peptidase [Bartonella sp. HY329]UXN08184.1 SOS response-associated peptidase [Bartonella sp. HY328]